MVVEDLGNHRVRQSVGGRESEKFAVFPAGQSAARPDPDRPGGVFAQRADELTRETVRALPAREPSAVEPRESLASGAKPNAARAVGDDRGDRIARERFDAGRSRDYAFGKASTLIYW